MDAVKVQILDGALDVKARIYGDYCVEMAQVSGLGSGLDRVYTADELYSLANVFHELEIEIQRFRHKKAASAAMMD